MPDFDKIDAGIQELRIKREAAKIAKGTKWEPGAAERLNGAIRKLNEVLPKKTGINQSLNRV